ncbi:hypothetical protein [Streptosporangium vulgare]|uniref:hypothetical protein n=1 Tax=Streptosporangium vulgare TaxID=46190 RepID=UPI0031D9E757
MAIRSAVTGWLPRSECATGPRWSSRVARVAVAATASASVRTVWRLGSSYSAQPDTAASSSARSWEVRMPFTVNSSDRSSGPVPARKPVNG